MREKHIQNVSGIIKLKDAEALARIEKKYASLKRDTRYRLYYMLLSELHRLWKKTEGNDRGADFAKILKLIVSKLKTRLETDWHLKYPVKPNFNPKWKTLFDKKLSRNSSLAKILYAFGIVDEKPDFLYPELIGRPGLLCALYPSGKPKKIISSRETLLATKRNIKFFLYTLHDIGAGYRELGRMTNLSKDTVRLWISEVAHWPEYERETIRLEMAYGRRFTDKDISDLEEARLVSDYSVPHKLSVPASQIDEIDESNNFKEPDESESSDAPDNELTQS